LIHFYAGGLTLSDEVVTTLVSKTKRASAAVIKELMGRAA
jgi:hypothetical protein